MIEAADSAQVSEYRSKLFLQFQKAQEEYLQRMKDRGQDRYGNQKLEQFLNSKSTGQHLDTVFPAAPKFNEIRQYQKIGKVTKNVVTRFFVIEGDLMTYYTNQDSTKPRKRVSLTDAVVKIEQFQDKDLVALWTNKNFKIRATIILSSQKKVHFYSVDLHELKALVSRVKIASSLVLDQGLQKLMPKVSIAYSVAKLDSCWKAFQQVYNLKVTRHLQNLGSNLAAVATMAHRHNRELLLLAREVVCMKNYKAKVGKALVSTFRTGKAKRKTGLLVLFSGQVINKKIDQLRFFISQRRSMRSIQTQNELKELCVQHSKGYNSSCVLEKFDLKGNLITTQSIQNGRVFFQKHSPGGLLIEDLTRAKLEDSDFFALKFTNELCLTDVSLMATAQVSEQEQTVVIYGPLLLQESIQMPQENISSELSGYSPVVRKPYDQYLINIKSVRLPLPFSKKYNNRGFIRVKLTQLTAQTKFRPYFFSRDFRLNFTDEQIKAGKPFIDTSFSFVVQKLEQSELERFKLEVVFVSNAAPVPLVVQKYLVDGYQTQRWDLGREIKYSVGQDLIQELNSAQAKGSIQIVFDIQHSKTPVKAMDQQEGVRLLVGRYCLLDGTRQMQVVQLNQDDTVRLRSIYTRQLLERNIPLSRIQFIERYGVSVYDLDAMPENLKKAKFAWKCKITFTNKNLLNAIQNEIQKAQINKIFQKRLTTPDVVSGKLLCSVLNARGAAKLDRPILKVQVLERYTQRNLFTNRPLFADAQLTEENIEKNVMFDKEVSWVDQQHPLGKIFDLGQTSKWVSPTSQSELAQDSYILLELHDQQQLIGQSKIPVRTLVNLEQQAKDLYLTLTKDDKSQGMLHVQTRFVPDIITRQNFHITEASYYLEAPEAYLHYQSLIQTRVVDIHQYLVPLSVYNPRDNESNDSSKVDSQFKPVIFKDVQQHTNNIRKHMIFKSVSGSGIADVNVLQRQFLHKQKSVDDAIVMKVFMSQEEIGDIQMWNKNHRRPIQGPYCSNLQYLQHAQGSQNLVRFNEEQSLILWNEFLNGLILNEKHYLSAREIDNEATFKSSAVRHNTAMSEIGVVFNKELTKFVFSGSWEADGDRNFADLFWLIHKRGVPTSLRSRVWRELLRVQVNEEEEIQHFITAFNSVQRYNPGWTIYVNYKVLSERIDCLAFRQVDEDIYNYKFSDEYLSASKLRESQIFWERQALREILKVLVLWSKDRQLHEEDISISYSYGTLSILQRMLSVCKGNSEEVFWIFTGLVMLFPQSFAVKESMLKQNKTSSVFRYELLALKCLVEHNLPLVFKKLKDFGLPLEFLVYESIISFYADFLGSELLLRLWDIIIFKFSTSQKKERKRGLWYLLAPAFLILRDRQQAIVAAESCEQIIQAYKQARAMKYNSDTFAQELDNTCEQLFVEQSKMAKNPIISKLLYGSQLEVLNRNAYYFEEQRYKYQQRVKELFKNVLAENESVCRLVQGPNRTISFNQIREELMESLKSVCLKQKNQVTGVHIYQHKLPNLEEYNIRISYGRGLKPQSRDLFQHEDMHESDEMISFSSHVNHYQFFKKLSNASHITIEMFEAKQSGKRIAYNTIRLSELPCNRFVTRTLLMKYCSPENCQTIPHLRASFFIEASSEVENELFASSIRKREPELDDIFNKVSQADMSIMVVRHKEGEYKMLARFLEKQKSLEIINDSYKCISQDNYGSIKLEEFQQLANKLLPAEFRDQDRLATIYNTFASNNDDEAQRVSRLQIFGTQKLAVMSHNQNNPSLRSFLASVILGSWSTVNEKFDLMFDLFDWADGTGDDIRPDVAFDLVSCVLQRCMYPMPHNELRNIIQYIFTDSVSMVLKAYWARFHDEIPKVAVDVTKEIQLAVNNYFLVYGNKVVDFNADSSAFAQLELLVGKNAQKLLMMGSEHHLILFCVSGGERFTFEVDYDQSGKLKGVRDAETRSQESVTDIKGYFERISGQLNLSGLHTQITKKKFLEKIHEIPFLVNLVRAETFSVDRRFGKFVDKRPIDVPIVVSCHARDVQLTFRFVSKYAQNIIEGSRFKLNAQGNYSFDMMSVYGEDTLAQLRVRIIEALRVMIKNNPDVLPTNIEVEIAGGRSWQCFGKEWVEVRDSERVQNIQPVKDLIWLKLESIQNESGEVAYDCFGIYKHSDSSYEWRPCRIMKRELKAKAEDLCYWIEFQHCRDQEMWVKRSCEDVILSVDYKRYQLGKFKEECLDFCRKLYN